MLAHALYADLLCQLHLCVVQLVHVAVDVVEVNILVVVGFQVIDGSESALGLRGPCYHEMAQYLIWTGMRSKPLLPYIDSARLKYKK